MEGARGELLSISEELGPEEGEEDKTAEEGVVMEEVVEAAEAALITLLIMVDLAVAVVLLHLVNLQ